MIEVVKTIIKEISFKKVENEDELFKSGILTSILVIDLATALEEEFNVTIPFNEIVLENFSTAQLIVAYIEKKVIDVT